MTRADRTESVPEREGDHVLGVVAEMMRRQHPAQEHAGQRAAEHACEHEQADVEAGHGHLPIRMPIVRQRAGRRASAGVGAAPSLLGRQD